MAMTKCRECSVPVSDQAKKCPACGISKPGRDSRNGCLIAIGITAAILIVMSISLSHTTTTTKSSKPDTPEQAAAKEARFQRELSASVGAITLRDMMRNPQRFEIIQATAVPDWFCYEYRGENGFGGLNRGFAVSDGTRVWSNDEGESLFQGHCRTGSGEDFTGAVKAALAATQNK